jgi:hypothetical protein
VVLAERTLAASVGGGAGGRSFDLLEDGAEDFGRVEGVLGLPGSGVPQVVGLAEEGNALIFCRGTGDGQYTNDDGRAECALPHVSALHQLDAENHRRYQEVVEGQARDQILLLVEPASRLRRLVQFEMDLD